MTSKHSNAHSSWAGVKNDPSAGTTLYVQPLLCPRCGGVKGRRGWDRPGLCADCRSVLHARRADSVEGGRVTGVMPRRCACGEPMEWRTTRAVDSWHGAFFCAHCDRGCTRAEAACGPCRRIKVKR